MRVELRGLGREVPAAAGRGTSGRSPAARPLGARREVRPPAETRRTELLGFAREQRAVDDRRGRAAGAIVSASAPSPSRLQRGAHLRLAEALRGRRGRGRQQRDGGQGRGESDHALSKTPQTRSKRPARRSAGAIRICTRAGVRDVEAESVIRADREQMAPRVPRALRALRAVVAAVGRAAVAQEDVLQPRLAEQRVHGARTSAPSRRRSPCAAGAIASPRRARGRGTSRAWARAATGASAACRPACVRAASPGAGVDDRRAVAAAEPVVALALLELDVREEQQRPAEPAQLARGAGQLAHRNCARKVWCLPLHSGQASLVGRSGRPPSATSRAGRLPAALGEIDRDRGPRALRDLPDAPEARRVERRRTSASRKPSADADGAAMSEQEQER